MKNKDAVNIPDGLGKFLQQRFGGILRAPIQPNPCGHQADSNARVVNVPRRITDESLVQAVREYYEPSGGSVPAVETIHSAFVVVGQGFKLVIALSNYTEDTGSESSRILLTVTEVR